MSTEPFIKKALALSKEGKPRHVMQLAFGEVDKLLRARAWERINDMFIDVAKNYVDNIHLVLVLLSLCFKARKFLPNFKELYNEFDKHLTEIKHPDKEGLLYGLKGTNND